MGLAFHRIRKHTTRGDKLFDIDEFDIPEGACIILSGQNGAGKTTLLKILAGLEAPDNAEITFDGQRRTWKAARTRLRREVVYLHQQPYMFDHSVADNVAYGLSRQALPKTHIKERVARALAWSGLSHLAQRNARELSGGEQQRVALTRARVLSPRLLLLDEPLANMDISAREQTIQLIRRLKEDGTSTIITSHEPHISRLLGDQHRHLCKTGPCRYTIIKPFLFQRSVEQGVPPSGQTTEAPDPGNGTVMTPQDNDNTVTAVILAGGMARRMDGVDKGLIQLNGRPMIEYIIEALKPQVDHIVINANRNLEQYRRYGYPVVKDIMGDYFGPLVGMASGLQACSSERILTVPCDSPFVPPRLAEKLHAALLEQDAELSVANDSERMQPVFAMLRRQLLPSLLAYLDAGGRKIDTWYAEHKTALADFSDSPDTFININTPEDKTFVEGIISAGNRTQPT
ncbi:MAG TPA: molybdenum cofactor guanylyltransferase [Gammaproteobacteria bacterium]|nr:molybdenum cofactor guanylyltransferase [Gammaproteobacteria bacterium]